MANNNLTLSFAEYAASTSVERIPDHVKERAKHVIADEIACAYFARNSVGGGLAASFAAQSAGPAEARIYATGQRVSAANAALANGAAGHGAEVDGAHVIGGHPGASIVHAAVAMAQKQRSTGADLLNAVVLGYETGVRILTACGGIYPLRAKFALYGDFLYGMGCATASSRLLGLDPARHCHAMALSTFGVNGLAALFAERRHISKSLCNGQFASAGVTAALMAAAGLEGHDDILGTHHGVLRAWGTYGDHDAIMRGLGSDFAIMGANFKFLNCGYPIHAAVEAALTLLSSHGIRADAIESVDVGLASKPMEAVNNRDMHNICLQDMVSAAIVRGGLTLRGSPFPEILEDPAYSRLRPRVTLRAHSDLDRDHPSGRAAIVTITTSDGKNVVHRVDHPRGHSLRGGVTWADLSEKWEDGLPECDVPRMMGLAQRLEELGDINELLDVLVPTH